MLQDAWERTTQGLIVGVRRMASPGTKFKNAEKISDAEWLIGKGSQQRYQKFFTSEEILSLIREVAGVEETPDIAAKRLR